MDGAFYNDLREPFIGADIASVTLASTYKAVVPLSNLAPLGTNYFGRIGKKVRIRLFGRITTGATPGNINIGILYGTGADANGTTVCESAAVALIASQTNVSFEAVFDIHCRAIGSSGSLFGVGKMIANPAVIASTAQPLMIPATAPTVVGSLDLTSATSVLSPQVKRSGSTTETVQIHDFDFIALN